MPKSIALLLLLSTVVTPSPAAGDERVPPVTDPVVNQECGSCHMAFQPQFLPQRSWQKLVDTLADHFGEDASLGETERAAVLDYHLSNAADGPKGGRAARKYGRRIAVGQAPLRITETPWWVKEHQEVRADKWRSREVKSKANCLACHKRAEEGIYEDEEHEDDD
ncbi:MAG: diheme cytochrome c [Deltaproteobacteria bacterium]|nr:diheme cytochrome c [Deltaproteobacteria bacterium]